MQTQKALATAKQRHGTNHLPTYLRFWNNWTRHKMIGCGERGSSSLLPLYMTCTTRAASPVLHRIGSSGGSGRLGGHRR